jgi:hypothetical protein
MDIDPATGILYLNCGQGVNKLYTVNAATGAVTLVGANGATAGFGIDGIAFGPTVGTAVPDPASTLGLLALGLAALAFHRRR